VFVNLYIPSALHWTRNGVDVSLAQKSSYPNDGRIDFEFSLSKPTELVAHFRIPAWAEGTSISVNGKRWRDPVLPGTFASLRRKWKNGDHVELEMPMKMRLQILDARNPDTVALLRGPLVLFAVDVTGEGHTPAVAGCQRRRPWKMAGCHCRRIYDDVAVYRDRR